MVAKKKFAEYTPIGDELSNVGAFVQAALALDQAASFAIETKDSNALANVALGWIEMASRLGGPGDEEEGEEMDMESSGDDYPLGFASPAVDAEVKKRREQSDSKSRD